MPDGKLQRLLDGAPGQVVLMDGGMGSTIEERGVDVRSALWGSFCFLDERGLRINDQVHKDFVDAGARIVIANTHNVRLPKCEQLLDQIDDDVLPREIAETEKHKRAAALHAWLHDRAVSSARRAVPSGAEVAIATCLGSVEPLGPYATESQILPAEACDRLRIEATLRQSAGVDLVIFETLTTRSEITGVALLGQSMDLGSFAVGLTCGPDAKTLAGVPVSEAAAILRDVKPAVCFVQCTRYDYVEAALRALVPALDLSCAAGVYANDGRLWKDRRWHGERIEPDRYAAEALKWQAIGARIIGGCCGIGPAHVAKLKQTLNCA